LEYNKAYILISLGTNIIQPMLMKVIILPFKEKVWIMS